MGQRKWINLSASAWRRDLNERVGSESDRGVRLSVLFASCLWIVSQSASASSASASELAQEAEQHGDIEVGVVLDATEQSGHASAVVRIHAHREIVWPLITSCTDAVQLVPGLVSCEVLETSADGTSQRIRQVLSYSWYVPKLTYELLATYDKPTHVSIERTTGDLKTLRVAWTLRPDGDYTVAQYVVDLAPGFWVPRWMVRAALRRDLPKMLRALRARAEFLQQH